MSKEKIIPMRPEVRLEKYFCKMASSHNALQYKFISGVTGVPDRILICNGTVAFVELKARNGVISERQKFVIKSLRQHGATVFVPFSESDIDSIFQQLSA